MVLNPKFEHRQIRYTCVHRENIVSVVKIPCHFKFIRFGPKCLLPVYKGRVFLVGWLRLFIAIFQLGLGFFFSL